MQALQVQKSWWKIALICCLVLATGCQSKSKEKATEEKNDLTSISLQLDWTHNHENVGMYMAEEQGYYADENLAVSLHPFEDKSSLQRLLAGEVQFGIMGADDLLIARSQGHPLVAITAIYQRNPTVFISLKDKNILKPEDLVGKKVYLSMSSTSEVTLRAMLGNVGVDVNEIELIPRGSDFSNDMLTNGSVDVMDAWLNNQPIALEAQGYELNAIFPFDYGVELYPNLIVTTETFIAENPEIVEGFVRATVKGMQESVSAPDESTEVVLKYASDLNPETEKEAILRSIPILSPTGSKPGMMTQQAFETTQQILLDQGILTEPLDLSQAYNMTFLNNVYSN